MPLDREAGVEIRPLKVLAVGCLLKRVMQSGFFIAPFKEVIITYE